MPIYISRELNDEFQSDAIGRQADLTRESIAAAPPIPDAGPPPPPPPPDQPPQPAPAAPTPPSDSLTNPTGQSPPDLQDLMAAAGLAQPSGGAAAQPTQAAAAPVSPLDSTGGPPPLQNLLQSAGLGDVGGAVTSAVSSAASAASSAAPPPLQDLMRSAGLTDTTPSAGAAPQQPATTPTPTQAGDVFPIPGWNGGKVQDHWGEVKGGSDLMAARGTPVVAMHAGKVIESGFNSVGGNSVLVQGDDGLQYYYAHFDKPPSVSVGDAVQAGTFLGPVGNTGDADHGPTHLHIGIGPSILLGADKNGGTGGSFDAVGKLQGALDGTQQAAAGTVPPQPATQTTAGLSGGGSTAGQVGDRGMQILNGAANAASWLGDQGQKAIQAVLVTEGGLNNARGDQGKSAGPLQFYEGGQLANLAQQMGMNLDQAKNWVEQNPIAAVQWAVGTPDKPGYLGAAIQRGISQGLSGADLATFAQRTGQVSVSPERAGANWNALFGGGQNVLQAAGNAAQGTAQAAGGAGQDLATRGAALVKQGQDLIDQANGNVQSVADYTRAKLAPINTEADRLTAANQQASDLTLQANQQAQDQRSVAASQATLGGGLRGRSAEFTAGGDGGQTPEQIVASQPAQPPQSNNPLDLVKQKFSDALDALGGLFGGGQPAPAAQPTGLAAIPAEGGGFGTAGAPRPATADLGPIGGAVQGVKSLTDQVQSPGTGNPLVDVPGVALSALGTGARAVSQGLEQVSPLGGGAVSIAGSDQMAQEFAARGGLQLQAQLQDLQQRRLNGEQGLEPQILDIGNQLTRINQDLTQGKPFNQAVEDAAQRNPDLPALQATAGIAAAGAATPLAAEGAPLVFRAIAEVLQPGTNPLELAHQATSLLGHADVAGPATRQAVQDAFTSFGLRWSDSAAQREQMLSRIGDTRGFLQRVQDNLASAAQGIQGAVGDLVQGRQGAQAMVQAPPETAAAGQVDRFYHGTGGDFARPDAGKFNENGLFGPGYYLTDDPRVAGGVVGPSYKPGEIPDVYREQAAIYRARGNERAALDAEEAGRQIAAEPNVLNRGYAQQRAPDINYLETTTMQLENNARALQTYRSTLAEAQRTGDDELANSMTTKVQQLEQAHDALQANIERATAAGPNVRPVDVPRDMKLLDADAPVTPEVVHAIADQLSPQGARELINSALPAENTNPMMRAQVANRGVATGDEVYRHLQELATLERARAANQGRPAAAFEPNTILERAGFDGIQYAGGNRVPMQDATGAPIQHTALVIFPNALDKLRNAVSGTAGGRIAPTFATDVAGAAAGGVAGNQSTPDDASPLERGARIAAGAALGGTVAHAGVGALLRARGLPPTAEATQSLRESAGRLAGQVRIGGEEPQPPVPTSIHGIDLSAYPEDIRQGLQDFANQGLAKPEQMRETIAQWVKDNPPPPPAAEAKPTTIMLQSPAEQAVAARASRARARATLAPQTPATPADNPFVLANEAPRPDAQPMSADEIADHFDFLNQQHQGNDARIVDLQAQLEASAPAGKVIHPPGTVGWTNAEVIAFARENGLNPYDIVGWPQGEGDASMIAQNRPRIAGGAQQSSTAVRQELAHLQQQQSALMDAGSRIANAGPSDVFYRPAAAETQDLPFGAAPGYTEPAANAPAAPVAAEPAVAQPAATPAAAGGRAAGAAAQRAPILEPAAATGPAAANPASVAGNAVAPPVVAQPATQGVPRQLTSSTAMIQQMLDTVRARPDADPATLDALQQQLDELRGGPRPSAPVTNGTAAAPAQPAVAQVAQRVQQGLDSAPAPVKQVAAQIGADQDGSRAFDLNALAQMRAQYQAQQPPLLQAAKRAPGVLDRFIGYTISNMLWGVGTATHITTSQALQTLGRPIITAASGHPVDAVRDATAMASSISDAFARFGRTIQTGQRQGLALQSPAAPTAAEQVLQFPLRLHSAINEFYRTLNAAGASAMEASRRLRENPDLSFQDVLQRYPQQIMDAGATAAARATFMEGGGAMKDIGAAIGKVSRDFMDSGRPEQVAAGVVLRWIVPMTHIPAVILGEGIRGLPVVNEVRGIQRATQLARSGQHFEAQQELGRTALTGFANMAILNEVAQGNITGDGPTSLAEKQRLMEGVDANGNATWRPNSVRLPDGRWLDYTGLGPVALSMSSVANSVEAAKDYLQKPPEQRTGGIPEFAQDLIGREMGTIGQTWFLRGLADVLTAVKEGTAGGTGTQISQAGDRLVPFGALLNEVRGMTDPLARNPQNPLERVESRLPFVSENVQPRLAATTGQPEQQPRDLGSVLFRGTPPGMMTPNPVADEVNRLSGAGLNVSVPYEVKSYKGAQQTPEAQQTIRAQVGQAVNQYVLNTISDPKYQTLDDAQKANAITSAIGQARSAADITLDQQVARSPHDSALLQWSQTAQYAGIPRGLPPEEVARQNWDIQQAKAKLAEYRAQYKDRAEGMLRRDDPEAYRLSQRDRLDTEILNKRKAAIDKATGGALSQADEKAGPGGLVGVGATTLRPPVP